MARDPASLLQGSAGRRNRAFRTAAALTAGFGPALTAALPAYAGFGLLVGILMGPTGMAPVDMAAGAAASPAVRAVLWTAWIAALAPAARRLVLAPELAYLRWLPIGRPLFWAISALGLLALELPWALLWHAASPPAGGVAAALAAAGAHATLAVRRRGAGWLVGSTALVAVAAALLARPAPDLAVAAIGAAALIAGAIAAFARAAEAPASLWRPRPRGGPVAALWVHHLGRLIDAALGGRVVVAAAVAGGLAGLFVRANQLDPKSALVAAIAAGAAGTIGVAARVGLALADDARALGWVTASAGVRGEVRAAGLVGAAVAAGAIAGAAVGAVGAALCGEPLMAVASAVAAIAPVAVAAAAAQSTVKGREVRVWGLTAASAAGLALGAAVIGPMAVVVVPGAALAAFGALAS